MLLCISLVSYGKVCWCGVALHMTFLCVAICGFASRSGVLCLAVCTKSEP